MRLAIMQPYVFPYIGYFQLINSADKFIIYDDVNFIKQGWINRNRILIGGKDFLFTVPLEDASSFKKINEVQIHKRLYNSWRKKFYKSLITAYSKAPFFKEIYPLVESVLNKDFNSIAELATGSILQVSKYLQIDTTIIESSVIYNNAALSGKERVIDICRKEKAKEYINLPGGTDLYSKDFFLEKGIKLYFIKPNFTVYLQSKEEFVPGLSIIDVMMHNSKEGLRRKLTEYQLS